VSFFFVIDLDCNIKKLITEDTLLEEDAEGILLFSEQPCFNYLINQSFKK
jgi:hypothetical protein